MAVICRLLLATAIAGVALSAQPTVRLSHGGELQGSSETFLDTPIDVFLGVRYAKPPVGDLRFEKPQPSAPWQGTIGATTVGKRCPQMEMFGDATKYVGDEDCLFLDIVVPGGVKASAKKPVMVWIHGGGYMGGTGLCYVGGSIAVTGDVIVVTINYRLGILGFLAQGKGTGNYGLWDQRAALLWVKENIEHFGGDPDLVTIFGESAGGGSVSSQLIGQHNDGLFKRGITQSGTAFMMFGMSEKLAGQVSASIIEQRGCTDGMDPYDCLRDVSAEDIVTNIQLPTFITPMADGDFFSDETADELSYSLAHRFDLMAGINGQEGGLFYEFELKVIAAGQNKSTDEGVDMDLVEDYLLFKCKNQLTPLSPNLCVDFIIRTYELREAADDKDRAIRLGEFLGESIFNVDTVNQLEQHSTCDKSTYGYYFTELYKPRTPNPLWIMRDWMKTKADHGDELPFMFGAIYIATEAAKGGIWKDMVNTDALGEMFMTAITEEDVDILLTTDMLKMWTNFAKSGNPNEPAKLSSKIPAWPEFTPESNSFLELNTKQFRIIPTPHKERLDSLRSNLLEARQLQQAADGSSSNGGESTDSEKRHDEL